MEQMPQGGKNGNEPTLEGAYYRQFKQGLNRVQKKAEVPAWTCDISHSARQTTGM